MFFRDSFRATITLNNPVSFSVNPINSLYEILEDEFKNACFQGHYIYSIQSVDDFKIVSFVFDMLNNFNVEVIFTAEVELYIQGELIIPQSIKTIDNIANCKSQSAYISVSSTGNQVRPAEKEDLPAIVLQAKYLYGYYQSLFASLYNPNMSYYYVLTSDDSKFTAKFSNTHRTQNLQKYIDILKKEAQNKEKFTETEIKKAQSYFPFLEIQSSKYVSILNKNYETQLPSVGEIIFLNNIGDTYTYVKNEKSSKKTYSDKKNNVIELNSELMELKLLLSYVNKYRVLRYFKDKSDEELKKNKIWSKYQYLAKSL